VTMFRSLSFFDIFGMLSFFRFSLFTLKWDSFLRMLQICYKKHNPLATEQRLAIPEYMVMYSPVLATEPPRISCSRSSD
jgi:hypothetical protein